MPTVTIGGATSGNSSVWSLPNAISPKTTSASIDTTVTMGRLIAKSDMNISCSPICSHQLSAISHQPSAQTALSSRASARDLLERHCGQEGYDDLTQDPSLALGMTLLLPTASFLKASFLGPSFSTPAY